MYIIRWEYSWLTTWLTLVLFRYLFKSDTLPNQPFFVDTPVALFLVPHCARIHSRNSDHRRIFDRTPYCGNLYLRKTSATSGISTTPSQSLCAHAVRFRLPPKAIIHIFKRKLSCDINSVWRLCAHTVPLQSLWMADSFTLSAETETATQMSSCITICSMGYLPRVSEGMSTVCRKTDIMCVDVPKTMVIQ